MSMSNLWDERYASREYVYGIEPNVYLKEAIERYSLSGKILFPGEGEGRNAVFAARMGLEPIAFDQSAEGKAKAMKLADRFGVKIDYRVGDLFEMDFEELSFDASALIYAHFSPNIRPMIHRKIGSLVKPGGIVILEGFSKIHVEHLKINPHAGGPRNIDMLFTKEMILSELSDFEPIEIEETETHLSEGIGHNGMASVIRFTGRKRL